MPTKDFEQTIPFRQVPGPFGPRWIPLVEVGVIGPDGRPVNLSLLFDTGADVTTLRADLCYLLGAQTWDEGELVETGTAGGPADTYRYMGRLVVFGRVIECPIHLAQLPPNPLVSGLLGREVVFDRFGFGFWESAHELYVTMNP